MARNRVESHEPREELEHLDSFDEGQVRKEFWDRQPGETNYAFGAFQTYLRIGASRRLKEAAARFYYGDTNGRYPGDTTVKPTQLWQVQRWSAKNSWVPRAEAFDAEEHNKWMQELEENRKKTIDQHLKVSRNLLAALNNRTREYLEGTERIPNSVFPSLLSTVTTLQRLTVGEATSRTEDSGKHVRQPDYSQLTDEEIAFLDDIGEKLYGGE